MAATAASFHKYSSHTHPVMGAMLSLLAEAMIVVDDKGKILSANEVAVRLLGNGQALDGLNIRGLFSNSSLLLEYLHSGKTMRNVALLTLDNPPSVYTAAISQLEQIGKTITSVISFSAADKTSLSLMNLDAKEGDRTLDKLYGTNESFLAAKRHAALIEPDENVLIIGESGVGKSSFARAIWAQGGTNKPLIVCNCASLKLLDPIVYLCGEYRNGKNNKGLFEMADGGTLLLEGIEDLPLDLQELFVRPYDNNEVIRDHDFKSISTNFRIIATASTNIQKMVSLGDQPGGFLPSLYFRLSQNLISIPSCRQRSDDLPLLINAIAGEYCEKASQRRVVFDDSAIAAMLAYSWPGNIREMIVAIGSAIDLCRHYRVLLQDLPDALSANAHVHSHSKAILDATTKSIEETREMQIAQAMQITGNNVNEAAKILGIGRSTLYKHLKKMHL